MDAAQAKTYSPILDEIDKDFIFVTVSGAHLYGFESQDSDLDLRGCHWPDLFESLKYLQSTDTFEIFLEPGKFYPNGSDIVSHNVLKYLNLMAKKPNGYILEQLVSPLIVKTSKAHRELIELSKKMVCKQISSHYGGFYKNQLKLLLGRSEKEIKHILYQARILCTAVNLAGSGSIEPNLIKANELTNLFQKDKIEELIDLKTNGENGNFTDENLKNHWLEQLKINEQVMVDAFEKSKLPNFDREEIRKDINDFVTRHIIVKTV